MMRYLKVNGNIVKTFFVFSTMMFLIMGVVSHNEACCVDGTKMIVLKIEGMRSSSCNRAINIALRKLDGVVESAASYKLGRAEVEYLPGRVTPEQMIKAINILGKYKAGLPDDKGGK